MIDIQVVANGSSLVAKSSGEITSGMVGIGVNIEYDNQWATLNKTAFFKSGNFVRKREGIGIFTTVPWEVLRKDGNVLEIGLEGRDSKGEIVMPTVWATVGTIRKGAQGEIPAAPEPNASGNESPSGTIIDDSEISPAKTWSSEKISEKISGCVKSVNGITPDENGNVEIETGGITEICSFVEGSETEETVGISLDNYEKQSKVISLSGNNLVYYDNTTFYTVQIPLDGDTYTKYILHPVRTYRMALLDKDGQYVADTYANNVDLPIEIDPNKYGCLVLCCETSKFSELVLQGVQLSQTGHYVLNPDVSPNFGTFGYFLFKSILNTARGKKVGILGDSITFGTGTTKKWWEYATERYGFGPVQVNAEVGRSFTRNGVTSTRFTEKVTELDKDCDVVIVFGGVNDYQFAAHIGTIDDTSTNENGAETPVTFYGAVKYVMEYLTTNFVNSRIIFFTPLPMNDNETFNKTNTAGHKVSDYADALKKAARAYGIDIVDLNAVGGFYLYNTSWMETNLPDGLHPNANGTKVYVENGIYPALDRMFIKYVTI